VHLHLESPAAWAGLLAMPLVAVLLTWIWRRPNWRPLAALLLIAAVLRSFSGAARDGGQDLAEGRESHAFMVQLRDLPRDGTLVIAERPVLLAARRYGAISVAAANARAGDIIRDLNQGKFSTILVGEPLAAGSAARLAPLAPLFKVQPLQLTEIDERKVLRVGKLLGEPLEVAE
jgi:hypothetical protein